MIGFLSSAASATVAPSVTWFDTFMLKRIQLHHLMLGMYVHEFCGSWMEHPFWKAQFLLKDAKDLARIHATALTECWIDTERGLDVPTGTASISRAEVEAQIDSDFSQLADLQPVLAAQPPPATRVRRQAPTSQEAELRMAATICGNARGAVASMFSQARMGRAVDTSSVADLVDEINDSVARNPGALISLARLKTADDYTYMHSVAVCALMVALARQLQLDASQTQLAGMAGLLHDLGKAATPLSVLHKPGKLTDEEFDTVRGHPAAGYQMLDDGGRVPSAVLDACLHHHEKMDGTGYPHKLHGEDISVMARMAAICDVYDAITSDRPYKRGWDPSESLRRMAEWSKHHFDLQLFQAFVKTIGIYPIGSLVRLTSGRIGVVTQQAPHALTTPTVKVFFSSISGMRITPREVDLSAPGTTEKIAGREDPERWNFPDLATLWSGFTGKAW